MTIQLAPDVEANIRRQMEDGGFNNEDDVMREALHLLELQRRKRREEQTTKLRPSEILELNREAVRRVFEGKHVSNPRVFGSVSRGEDRIDSDLDILVDPTTKTSLFDLAALERELEELLGIPVDVLTPNFLPAKERDRVVSEAQGL